MDSISLTSLVIAPSFRPIRIAIVLTEPDRETRAVADALASRFVARGYLADVVEHLDAAALDRDAIVFGCRAGPDPQVQTIAHFVAEVRPALAHVATAVFLVGAQPQHPIERPMSAIDAFVAAARWRPDLAAAFEHHPGIGHHGAMVQWVLRHVGRRADPVVATAADVMRFADAIAGGLASARARLARSE